MDCTVLLARRVCISVSTRGIQIKQAFTRAAIPSCIEKAGKVFDVCAVLHSMISTSEDLRPALHNREATFAVYPLNVLWNTIKCFLDSLPKVYKSLQNFLLKS